MLKDIGLPTNPNRPHGVLRRLAAAGALVLAGCANHSGGDVSADTTVAPKPPITVAQAEILQALTRDESHPKHNYGYVVLNCDDNDPTFTGISGGGSINTKSSEPPVGSYDVSAQIEKDASGNPVIKNYEVAVYQGDGVFAIQDKDKEDVTIIDTKIPKLQTTKGSATDESIITYDFDPGDFNEGEFGVISVIKCFLPPKVPTGDL